MSNHGRKRRPVRVSVVLAAVAAAMLLLAGCGGSGSQTSGTQTAPATGQTDFKALEVGQCLRFVAVSGETPDANGDISVTHEVVDCALTGQFKYLVTHSFDGEAQCPNNEYSTYYQRNLLGGKSKSFCVAPVFEAGSCYRNNDLQDPEVIACTDSRREFMVESVSDGIDPASCSVPEQAIVIPEPAPGKVYCLTA